jgi:hypothetical protein
VLIAVDIGALAGEQAAGPARCAGAAPATLRPAEELPQVDLVPALAAATGVPVPFGNLGRLSTAFWALAAGRCTAPGAQAATAMEAAARGNARQVHRYLNAYASTPMTSFPRAALAEINDGYTALPPSPSSKPPKECAEACLSFIADAVAAARGHWMQFRLGPMAAGVAIFLGALGLNGYLLMRNFMEKKKGTGKVDGQGMALSILLLGGAMAHCIGIFSFFFLLTEGRGSFCPELYISFSPYFFLRTVKENATFTFIIPLSPQVWEQLSFWLPLRLCCW